MSTTEPPGEPIHWHGKDPTVLDYCAECGAASGFGWATHRGTCSVVALPKETTARLQAQLREFDRARMRAAAEARTAVIG